MLGIAASYLALGLVILLGFVNAHAKTFPFDLRVFDSQAGPSNNISGYPYLTTGSVTIADAAVQPNAFIPFTSPDFLGLEVQIPTAVRTYTFTWGVDEWSLAGSSLTQGLLLDGNAQPLRFDIPQLSTGNGGYFRDNSQPWPGKKPWFVLDDQDGYDFVVLLEPARIGTLNLPTGSIVHRSVVPPGVAVMPLNGTWSFSGPSGSADITGFHGVLIFGPACGTGVIDASGVCAPPTRFALGATTTDDQAMCPSLNVPPSTPTSKGAGSQPMCMANAYLALVSLNLNDTPVGYAPAVGPPVYIRLTYNHHEAGQPASFTYFNVGPKWTLNVLSFIQDDPAAPGAAVTRAVGGGGFKTYTGYSNGAFAAETQTAAVLTRTPASGAVTSYTLTFPNGARHVFATLDGATSFPRRVFLSRIIDPQGNALTFNYTGLLLTSITDAAGRSTTFAYSGTQVTQITDPFGRTAAITYANGKIATITDVFGLQSAFTYDTADPGFITAMTTPYGTSTFVYSADTTGNRVLELTDPLGKTARIESRTDAPGIAATPAAVPGGIGIAPGTFGQSNTFLWDRHVNTAFGHTDFTQAAITHWLTDAGGGITSTPAAIKPPLENYVFFNYPGQPGFAQEGALASPSALGRVLDDGTAQLGLNLAKAAIAAK